MDSKYIVDADDAGLIQALWDKAHPKLEKPVQHVRKAYDYHEVEKTCLSYETGDTSPDGGSTETHYADICPDCMRTKVFPWLQSQGVKIEMKEVDW